jgi:hypothetical protein
VTGSKVAQKDQTTHVLNNKLTKRKYKNYFLTFCYLLLWNDDLGGEPVLGVGDGMVQQTDAAHHLSSLLHLVAATDMYKRL